MRGRRNRNSILERCCIGGLASQQTRQHRTIATEQRPLQHIWLALWVFTAYLPERSATRSAVARLWPEWRARASPALSGTPVASPETRLLGRPPPLLRCVPRKGSKVCAQMAPVPVRRLRTPTYMLGGENRAVSRKSHSPSDLGAVKISGAEWVSRYRKSENLQFSTNGGLEFSLNRSCRRTLLATDVGLPRWIRQAGFSE